ncbi:hypothetical protein DL96DRAFT_1565337 [Flagelloscypha sp. PMI_526]|nr:hypothetical protein DL96DRAFT_1565337 [Flagelloscypha sp. PMI_526]
MRYIKLNALGYVVTEKKRETQSGKCNPVSVLKVGKLKDQLNCSTKGPNMARIPSLHRLKIRDNVRKDTSDKYNGREGEQRRPQAQRKASSLNCKYKFIPLCLSPSFPYPLLNPDLGEIQKRTPQIRGIVQEGSSIQEIGRLKPNVVGIRRGKSVLMVNAARERAAGRATHPRTSFSQADGMEGGSRSASVGWAEDRVRIGQERGKK